MTLAATVAYCMRFASHGLQSFRSSRQHANAHKCISSAVIGTGLLCLNCLQIRNAKRDRVSIVLRTSCTQHVAYGGLIQMAREGGGRSLQVTGASEDDSGRVVQADKM